MRPSFGMLRRSGGYAAGLISAVYIATQPAISAAVDFDGSVYARNVSLHTNLDIFWTIDIATETIRVAVHAKAASGWAGVGISEMGGMEGADILYYETATGNVTDAHALAAETPVIDECTQDWTLLSTEAGNGSLVFEAERALDTGDTQDRVFTDDSNEGAQSTRLIAAWGDEEIMTYHVANSAKGEVIMFGGAENSNTEVLADGSSSSEASFFDVTAKNFTIPTVTTWYEDSCTTASELPSLDKYHAIRLEGAIEEDTSEYVHHLVVTAWTGTPDCWQSCDEWFNQYFPSDRSSSRSDSSSSSFSSSSFSSSSYYYLYFEENNITIPEFCKHEPVDIFAWAPGVSNLELPDDVGFLFGNASGGYTSVSIQTHYNNPNGDDDMVDSSGVRVYYTTEERPMQMGVMRVGDPYVALHGQPIPDGKSSFSFSCPSSCTEEHFEDDEVTVFGHFLHMHENGQRFQTRQYRNDGNGTEVLVHTANVDYYSFLQAGGFRTTSDGGDTIQRGDRFEAECFYDTSLSSVDSDSVTFGFGSEQEMCIDYIYYYPAQNVPDSGACGFFACDGNLLGWSELDVDSDFNRTFGIVDTCTMDMTDDDEDDDSSSSSSSTLPGLGLLAFSAITVLTIDSIALTLGARLS